MTIFEVMNHNQIYMSNFVHNLMLAAKSKQEERLGFMTNVELQNVMSFGKHGTVQVAYLNGYLSGELDMKQAIEGFALYLEKGIEKE